MPRLTDLFKSLVSPTEEIQTPSFIKAERSSALLPAALSSETSVAAQKESNLNTQKSDLQKNSSSFSKESVIREKADLSREVLPREALNSYPLTDKIDVPVYQSDSEWDVVQRSINLFADHANLSREVKQAFVKKWVTEMAKAEQTSLYRDDEEKHGHLGNEINRANANQTTGLLGTYQAMIHPGRQARMNDELKALQCIEKFDLGIIDWQLSRDFKMDLITVIIGTIEEQKIAAQNLFQKAQNGQPEASKIYLATKALANSSEMRLNAAIKTAVLKMDTAKFQFGRPPIESNDAAQTTSPTRMQSVKKSEQQANIGKENDKEAGKPKISESNWVDEQAAKLLGNIRY